MLIKLLHLAGESQLLDLEGWEPEKILTVDLEHGHPTCSVGPGQVDFSKGIFGC